MKTRKKINAVNNQEDEDFEVYTLHPENAIQDADMTRRIKKNNPDSQITGSTEDSADKAEKNSPLTFIRGDD